MDASATPEKQPADIVQMLVLFSKEEAKKGWRSGYIMWEGHGRDVGGMRRSQHSPHPNPTSDDDRTPDA